MMEKIHNLILIIFVYADTHKVTEEDCLHSRVRLAEVEPRVVPKPGLSTSRSARTEQRGHVRRLSTLLRVRLTEVEPQEVPEPSLSTSLNKEVTSANSFKSCFLLPGPLGRDKLLSLLILSMNF